MWSDNNQRWQKPHKLRASVAGETNYVMDLIKTYHEQAQAKSVRIVPCCGYDSIPSGDQP